MTHAIERLTAETNRLCQQIEQQTNLLAYDLVAWENGEGPEYYSGHPGPSEELLNRLRSVSGDLRRAVHFANTERRVKRNPAKKHRKPLTRKRRRYTIDS